MLVLYKMRYKNKTKTYQKVYSKTVKMELKTEFIGVQNFGIAPAHFDTIILLKIGKGKINEKKKKKN